jgi:hypothetical protein
MKVQELIDVLKRLKPDSEVLIRAYYETVIQDEDTVCEKVVKFNEDYFSTDYDYDGNFVIFTSLEDEDEEDFYETPEQRAKERRRSELYREYIENGGTLSWDEFHKGKTE